MTDNKKKINELLKKVEILLKRQEFLQSSIKQIQSEIKDLKSSPEKESRQESQAESIVSEERAVAKPPVVTAEEKPVSFPSSKPQKANSIFNIKGTTEDFIGSNLIGKIGITITVIGAGIGVKYAIDNDLISPLMRIILGYLLGFILLALAFRLKKDYKNFSAVLLSGAVAIMYLISYAAHSFYGFIPLTPLFFLLLLFTVFAVWAALKYNRQIIAHLGLVGAYVIPLLLNESFENVSVFFGYMAIINTGILAIALRKYWKPLYYSSFFFTWYIYFIWYVKYCDISTQLAPAIIFLCIFFAQFYIMVLAYKMRTKRRIAIDEVLLVLANAFIFYGAGYSIVSDQNWGDYALGIFTIINALVHFMVSLYIYKTNLAEKGLFYLLLGLGVLFVTIAIPVQYDGNWVTLLWTGEAALLFGIGRTKGLGLYEKIAYPLILLAFFSLVHDWLSKSDAITPFLNIGFFTAVFFIAAFSVITYLLSQKHHESALKDKPSLIKMLNFILPAILIGVLYFTFRLELEKLYDKIFLLSENGKFVSGTGVIQVVDKYENLWVINYSILFFLILSIINIQKLRNNKLGLANLILNIAIIFIFLFVGLVTLNELGGKTATAIWNDSGQNDLFYGLTRYLSYILAGSLIAVSYHYIRQKFIRKELMPMPVILLLHLSVIWMLSSELIHWLDIFDSKQSDKLGLSILWGLYAVFLIVLGIWKQKKYLRIAAISLFGITLIKLFFYDIAHIGTIDKTIIFLCLGALLLIISFLYNKYKDVIVGEGG